MHVRPSCSPEKTRGPCPRLIFGRVWHSDGRELVLTSYLPVVTFQKDPAIAVKIKSFEAERAAKRKRATQA